MPPTGRRTVLFVGAAIVVILAAAVTLSLVFARQDVGYAEKCSGNRCWGYELSRRWITGDTTLRFWGTWGLDISYSLPRGDVEKVSDHWLATDRAAILDLRWRPEKAPATASTPIHILYDFQRGELMVQSSLAAWRLPDYRSGKPDKNWLTEEQFRHAAEAIDH
ncbi:MAG TPA: hypothetical protein VHD76_16305 [Bryobacteraceae bacterium]|jgi:hypothetical protein|nr:hypothetical protein [Bryobacteraceae bacterium]